MLVGSSALDAMVRTMSGEARGESPTGQAAVAWVILNRARYRPAAWWGSNVYDVCHKRLQFSCWNGGPNTEHIEALEWASKEYSELEDIALSVLLGNTPDPTGGATFYQVTGTNAPWSRGKLPCAIIGHHSFYRLPPDATETT